MHSPVDFTVSGLEVGDRLTCYLVSGLEVRIALILYARQGRKWVCAPPRMQSPVDFRVSGLEVGNVRHIRPHPALASQGGSGIVF